MMWWSTNYIAALWSTKLDEFKGMVALNSFSLISGKKKDNALLMNTVASSILIVLNVDN